MNAQTDKATQVLQSTFNSKWKIAVSISFLCLIVSIITLHIYLGTIVKNGVELFSDKYFGLKTTIGDADINLLAGTATIQDLAIKNPRGFSENDAFYLRNFKIKLDLGSLTENTIRIHRITIQKPIVGYEKSGGTTNLNEIQRLVASKSSSPSARQTASKSDGAAKAAPAKKVVIDYFKMWDGEVMANLHGVKLDVTVPTIEMRDIGKKSEGMDAGKAANMIIKEITRNVASLNPGKLVQNLGKTVANAAGEVGNVVKDVGGAAGDGVGKAAKGVGDAVKGVGNVFGL